MKTKHLLLPILAAAAGLAVTASAQSTAFNYTGYLLQGNAPANGSNDLRFALYAVPTGGSPLASSISLTNQPVNNGVFVISLDFGDVFDGSPRWLEISARPGGSSNPFTNTFPRQPITTAPYAINANNGVPSGAMMPFAGTNVPNGWILCDGRPLKSSQYPRLFAAIGTAWGTASDDGDPTTDFRAPDTRGMFLRGVDDSPVMGTANRDPDHGDAGRGQIQVGSAYGNRVGSWQADVFASHAHNYYWANTPGGAILNVGGGPAVDVRQSTTTTAAGGSETRPKNVYVNYIIKY